MFGDRVTLWLKISLTASKFGSLEQEDKLCKCEGSESFETAGLEALTRFVEGLEKCVS